MIRFPVHLQIRAFFGRPSRLHAYHRRLRFLEVARRSCRDAQQHVLQGLLRLNSGTQFARDHGLRPNMSLPEFRQRIPVSDYELIRPYVDRVQHGDSAALLGAGNRLRMFAVTSGTTAASKLIPVTDRFVQDYRRGWRSWGIGAYERHPQLRYLNIIQISSSHQRFRSPCGVPCGSISGLVASMQGPVVRSLYCVPPEVAEITDIEAKRYTVLRCSVPDKYAGMLITANPSTVLQLTETLQLRATDLIRDIRNGSLSAADVSPRLLAQLRPSLRPQPERARELEQLLESKGQLSPTDVWPALTVLGVWCGGSAAAYLPQLRRHFPGVVIRDHGLHASEGRMTMPLDDENAAGVLEVQTHFFEFLPLTEADSSQPVVLEAHELQEGQEYLILLTTSSGLYRYNIQDVVRCVGFYGQTPLLEFRHKGSHISSITGEKIAESQVVEAVQTAAQDIGFSLQSFTLTPEWSDPPGYTLFVEIPPLDAAGRVNRQVPDDDLYRLARHADQRLCEMNSEYQEKRVTQRLRGVHCVALPRTAWQRFHASRTAQLGGTIEQYKHPCLLPDPHFQRLFQKACCLD